ncbi:Pleckstrin -like proteiny domain-containing family G member 7 [Takifugu flavidus]|uniref:Pleckstrin-like proteiny domain-containing family G member 7 n=1 Tax=Takifugu flavidus TaxID=433684 RepID=A0A5C6P9E0_9TELE|nr:Pleckstrin -like proteiny domain-containing family G member 7 [Takifugu flavidus]
MSTLKHVILQDKDQDVDQQLEWSYIEWAENEVVGGGGGTVDAQTQTDSGSFQHKESQTSSPVIMHMDLTRSHSKLRQSSLVDSNGLVAPLLQFDRQAPGRISTSPTLRRMRSTRRPLTDPWDPENGPSPLSPLFQVQRVKSPLAASTDSDGKPCHSHQPSSSCGQQRPRSYRSKTLDNGVDSKRPECHSALPAYHRNFIFPESEFQDKVHLCNRLQERRRSSVVVSLPGLDVSPGDLFVSNGVADILNDNKKPKWPFSSRSTTKGKPQTGTVSDVQKYLSKSQIPDWRNSDFQKYKDCTLLEFLQDQSSPASASTDPEGLKRQEAIWELFTSECFYFLDQLMVLKEVFFATLSNLQMKSCLADVDSWRLFANLNELCLVSFSFLTNLLRVIKSMLESPEGDGPTLLELLSTASIAGVFQESICHCLQKYCLNYSAALLYLDKLKLREDFGIYVKWCERNELCRRLQLRDLLVAPLQRLTRYPLLLRNMAKRCRMEDETKGLQSVAEQVDTSICDLEGKVKWLDNYQKVKQLRDALVWLPVWERDKRAFVPETLKHLLKAVTLENLISHRSLLHEGKLVLTENTKLIDVYLFLFDEFLLITKIKRNKKKSVGPEQNPLRLPQNQELDQFLKEGCTFTVLDQPLSLDRLQLRNIDQLNASSSGLPHSFIIMHQNRYQQCIGAFILQAASESNKKEWMSKLEGAVTTLLKLDSVQPRVKSSTLWLESAQI